MTDPAATPTPPIAIPGLAFERPVGIGGTSVVWLARQTALDRPVAVKILDPSRLADPAERARFQEEARAAARLASPSIVQILDFGDIDGHLYYTMEYVAGGSLADWLRDNPQMPPSAVWQLLQVVASTLDAAWQQLHIVHGDIKPANILLTPDGTVKLADLGLATLADPRAVPVEPGYVEGTPTYFAPEQIDGVRPSPQSDMYALGLTAYHLLTGRPPFEGLPTPDAVLEAQRSDYLPDPVPLSPGLSSQGAWFLQKLTAKSPALRPASWADVLSDLARVAADQPPAPPYPDPADATILLDRSRNPTALDAARPCMANGRRVIRVATPSSGASSAASASSSSPRPAPAKKRSSSGGGFVKFLLFLLFFAAVLAAIWFFALKDHPEYLQALRGQRPTPAYTDTSPSPLPPGKSETSGDSGTSPSPDSAPDTPSAPSHPLAPNGAWTHPDYIALATRFNALLERYRTAAALNPDFVTRPDGAAPALHDDPVWPYIATEATAIAAGLDALLPQAPADFPLRDAANQAWQLATDAALMTRSPARKAEDFHNAPKHRHADLAPWPAPVPENPASPFATLYFQLGYAWDALPAPASPLATDLTALLAPAATPSPSTRSLPGVKLLGPFTALMPVADAAKALGAPLPPRRAIRDAVFPASGVFRYDFDAGRFGAIRRPSPPYPRLSLLADADDRLLALYFYDPSPSSLVHDPLAFTTVTRAGDFVEPVLLPENSSTRATHNLLTGTTLYRLDSETADFSSDPPAPLRQSTLIFPDSLANALLYHLLGRYE